MSERAIETLQPALDRAAKTAATLRDKLAALRQRHEEHVRRRTALQARYRAASAERKAAAVVIDIQIPGEVDDRFAALENRIAEAEALVDAEWQLDAQERADDIEVDAVVKRYEVDAALADLRERVANRS